MTKITYQYENPTNNNETDRPPPLIIRLDDFKTDTIEKTCEFLIDSIELRFNLDGINTHLESRPLIFEFGDAFRLNEYTFWRVLYESKNANPQLGRDYLDAVVARQKGDELPHCRYDEVVGQHPTYAFLDKYIFAPRDSHRLSENDLLGIDLFIEYMQVCDIDHEAWHQDYIGNTLDLLRWQDLGRFEKLMLLYLDTQFAEYVLNFQRMSAPGFLKKAIDHAIKKTSGWSLRVECLELCSHVYGVAFEPTCDVLQYCRLYKDLDDDRDLVNFSLPHIRARRQCDAEWNDKVGNKYDPKKPINTGFHILKERGWTRVEDVCFSAGPSK